MSMGERKKEQGGLFVPHTQLPRSQGHPFYEVVNRIFHERGFDRFAEQVCREFYSSRGRPSLAPGVYFRCLMVGYFEGIDSERGIAWRVNDSLSLREFVGIPMGDQAPDHSTISRTRRLLDLATHREVFNWVLGVLADQSVLKGKTVGVDATTLEANAAMRSIVRRDDGRGYQEFLTDLAKASGIETPTRDDLARIDRRRKKKTSNDEWVNPHDPDAEVTKMKDGRTHLAYKQEHAVDMESGAVVAVTVHGGAEGDTSTLEETLADADENLASVQENESDKPRSSSERVIEVVTDKGYHSNDTTKLLDGAGIRSYVSEPERGRRNWSEDGWAKTSVYANRRRIRGRRGKRLMAKRGELLERSFAHTLNTGGMRRVHLRGCDNILKRSLIHVAGFNLGVLMRTLIGVGTPRALQRGAVDVCVAAVFALSTLIEALIAAILGPFPADADLGADLALLPGVGLNWPDVVLEPSSATGC